MPREVIASISEEDKAWMRELYESPEFRRYKKRYIELQTELDRTEGVEKRGPLVVELYSILDGLKSDCG